MALGLDAARNEAHTNRRDGVISREDSRVAVYFIPTDEELLIARDAVPQRYYSGLRLGVTV